MSIGYIKSAIKQFSNYKALGEKAMAQMSDASLNWQANIECNSVANVVRHLSGNMISRFTDFLTTDGEKTWRNRDIEFEFHETSRPELLAIWEKGWACLFLSLNTLTDDDLDKTVLIRNEEQSVLEAINRQIAHYSYHVGQIVMLAKICDHEGWQALTIPRNKSDEFNAAMFGKKKD